VLIPAGEFLMGTPEGAGEYDEQPKHKVHLDAFFIDKYEVTNAKYAKFLNEYGKNTDDDGHKLINLDDKGCLIKKSGGAYIPKPGYEEHPVIYVTWYGAYTYARFYKKRLPTEAEWERAARGGLVGKKYPWGDSISHDNANYRGMNGRDKWENTAPVGSFPPNGYGLYDMAGNVLEWCSDNHEDDYYSKSPHRNPQGPKGDKARVCRGGSWFSITNSVRAAYRISKSPSNSYNYLGFRCVLSF